MNTEVMWKLVDARMAGCHPARVIYIVPGSPPPEPPARDCPDYPLGIDDGRVAPSQWLIADGFCLHDDYVTLFYSLTGAVHEQHWEPSALNLNAWYDADVSPTKANYHGAFGLSEDGKRVEGSIVGSADQ